MVLNIGLLCVCVCVCVSVCLCLLPESVGLRGKVLRKIEELKGVSVCSGVPDEYLCPITRELMKDPVIAAGELNNNQGSKLYTSKL